MELGGVIGENIRRAREARGWSLEKLGARCDPPTSYGQISRLEKGERRLTLDWVEKLAAALQMDPIALISGQPASKPEPVVMSEQVANEVARSLGMVALDGAEPDPGTVQVISLMLQELTATFSAYPQAYSDPAIARPVVDLAARRRAHATT